MNFDVLKEYAATAGIHAIGWFKPAPFQGFRQAIEERKTYHKIEYRTYEDFMRTASVKKGIHTVIVVVVDYFHDKVEDNKALKLSNYSRFCWQTVNPRAELVADFLRRHGYSAEILDLPERAAACKAGLGFIGKNCMFYAYGLGSYVGIHSIGTDLKFDEEVQTNYEEQTKNKCCENCGKCIDSCPTGAVSPEGYEINPQKCISFINRHAEERCKVVPEDMEKLDGWLHGCEVCQNVCPVNRAVEHKQDVVFNTEIDLYGMRLPNQGYVERGTVEQRFEGIQSPDFKDYVRRLLGRG